MNNLKWALFLCFALISTKNDAQQIGDLDTTFNATGKVITDLVGGNDGAQGVAIQSDGKIVVVGYTGTGNNNKFGLTRYNVDGSLDTSFGGTGIVITDFAPLYDYASCVAIQSDGKIIAAGQKRTGSSGANALIRYNTDGSLDTTFGTGGKVETVVGVADAGITSIRIQPDGKIVASGICTNPAFGRDFAVVRYNSDGSIDTSFGVSGIDILDFNATYDFAFAIELQPDGKILVGGAAGPDPVFDFALMRLDTVGNLDLSFGTGGKVITNLGSNDDWVNAMTIQPDGKIILAGYSGFPSKVALTRYTDVGTLDSTFGVNGLVLTQLTSADQANAICLQPDGKIVVAGSAKTGTNNDFHILRYTSVGALDTSFSVNGSVTTDFGATNEKANAVALQADGKIVAAGVSGQDFAVARYITSLTTGLIDFENEISSLLIYPNPIADEAILNYSLSRAEKISINLVDISGRIVKNFISDEYREASSHSQLLSFPSNLAHGSYFIVISNASKNLIIQIVK